jgi:hypothetical protein
MLVMQGRIQLVTAIVIAYVVAVILISPVVSSPPTTAPTRHTLQRPNVIVHMAAIAWATAAHASGLMPDSVLQRTARPTPHDTDLAKVITALLC